MNAYQTLEYSSNDTVATIQLHHQHSTMKMVQKLTAVCDHLEDHSSCQVVVFKGQMDASAKELTSLNFDQMHQWTFMDLTNGKRCVGASRPLPKATIALLEERS